MPSTYKRMKNDIETGWDEVLWSQSYGWGDLAAITACAYLGCLQSYLGHKLNSLINKVGEDFLEQVMRNKGKVLVGPGDLQVQAGDAYWSVYHKIWNPLKWRHEKVVTERYVRLYVRYRREDTVSSSDIDVASIVPRFRAVNDMSGDLGYEGGFPNFHQADYGQGVVFGSTLLKPDFVDRVDILADKLGNPSGVEERFRAVNDYARNDDYIGGFPNFHQADYGNGVVYGAILINPEAADPRDISKVELGNPSGVEERFRAVNDYARNNGYTGGFPNFHQADYGSGVVYGTILIKPEAADPRDVGLSDLKALYQ